MIVTGAPAAPLAMLGDQLSSICARAGVGADVSARSASSAVIEV